MQKAGSKAIQHFSVDNKEALGALGITYARGGVDRGVWHRRLFTDYDDEMDDLIKSIMRRHDKVILSFERAYLAPKLIIARLASLASEMNVFFVVREPVSWLNSWINQIAKAHRATYQQFIDQTTNSEAVREALAIDEQLARWEEFTPRERITAVEYAAHDNVLDPYMDWLGIPPSERARFKLSGDDPNRALDEASLRVFLEVKRQAGKIKRAELSRTMQRAHDAVDQIRAASGEPFRLVGDEMAAKVVETYQPSFDRVMQRYGAPGITTRFAETRAATLQRRVLDEFEPLPEELALAHEIVAGQ